MSLHSLDNTLIVGAGPVAQQVAVLLSNAGLTNIGLTNRCSNKWKQFIKQYQHEPLIKVSSPKRELVSLTGQVTLNRIYEKGEYIDNCWSQLILCIPSDAYLSFLSNLPLRQLTNLKAVILISPAFGSHALVKQYLKAQAVSCEVICFSNYFAATKYHSINDQPVLNENQSN